MNIETNNSSHQSIKYRVVAGESQWALIWKRFKKHRLAQISGIVLIFLYTIAAFAEFLSQDHPPILKPVTLTHLLKKFSSSSRKKTEVTNGSRMFWVTK